MPASPNKETLAGLEAKLATIEFQIQNQAENYALSYDMSNFGGAIGFMGISYIDNLKTQRNRLQTKIEELQKKFIDDQTEAFNFPTPQY